MILHNYMGKSLRMPVRKAGLEMKQWLRFESEGECFINRNALDAIEILVPLTPDGHELGVIPVKICEAGEVEGLPKAQTGHGYIVPDDVRTFHPGRNDFFSPSKLLMISEKEIICEELQI